MNAREGKITVSVGGDTGKVSGETSAKRGGGIAIGSFEWTKQKELIEGERKGDGGKEEGTTKENQVSKREPLKKRTRGRCRMEFVAGEALGEEKKKGGDKVTMPQGLRGCPVTPCGKKKKRTGLIKRKEPGSTPRGRNRSMDVSTGVVGDKEKKDPQMKKKNGQAQHQPRRESPGEGEMWAKKSTVFRGKSFCEKKQAKQKWGP